MIQLDNKSVTGESLKGGAALEWMNDALAEVIANCVDPNTDPKTVRKIVLEVTVNPSEKERRFAIFRIHCKTVLAQPKKLDGSVYLGQQGEVVSAFENNPDQTTMELPAQKEVKQDVEQRSDR